MADAYEIQYRGKTVGTVRREKQGLYHCFHCRCTLPDDCMYRIHAIAGDKRENLGICIPVEGRFGMDKKIPLKRLGEESLTFQLVEKDWKPAEPVAEPELPAQEKVVEEKALAASAAESAAQPETAAAEKPESLFVPVSEHEPFEQLDMLENAHMEIRDDTPGIVIEHEREG